LLSGSIRQGLVDVIKWANKVALIIATPASPKISLFPVKRGGTDVRDGMALFIWTLDVTDCLFRPTTHTPEISRVQTDTFTKHQINILKGRK